MKTFKEIWECNACEHVKNEANNGLPAPCVVSITFRDETSKIRRFRKKSLCLCDEPMPPIPDWKFVELKEI